MTRVTQYWRPRSLEEAFSLLARPGTCLIGGGTTLAANDHGASIEVVDLQGIGLDGVRPLGDASVEIGAMTTLEELSAHDALPVVVRDAARRERPSTLRAQSTLGGLVVRREFDSELLAALLVHEATVQVASQTWIDERALSELLGAPGLGTGEILVSVRIDPRGRGAAVRTARTSADRAIVVAVARRYESRRWLALAGIDAVPVLVDPTAGFPLAPPGDFRGSSDYRAELARILAARATEEASS